MQFKPRKPAKTRGKRSCPCRSSQSHVSLCQIIHKPASPLKRIAESTVRRLSLYLRFLEEFEAHGHQTISSGELASQGGTTSAQVRKDLSFFGSFGKRGLGYSVSALSASLREILGLGRQWNVIIVGAGKIGAALAQYKGFRERGFKVSSPCTTPTRRESGDRSTACM